MKKSLLYGIILIGWAINSHAQEAESAKTLEGGEVLFDAGLGFGVHIFSTNEEEGNIGGGVPGLLYAGIGYNVLPNLALGVIYERNGYLTDPDSAFQVVSNNLGLSLNYHVFNRNNILLDLGMTFGTSSFRFENFRNNESLESQGSQVKFLAGIKRYFNDNIGVYMAFTVPIHSYKTFKDQDGNVYEIYDYNSLDFPIPDSKRNFEISLSGFNFNFGMTVKI